MAGLRKSKKNEDGEKWKDVPPLNADHYREINNLYKLYGKDMSKLMTYWKAAKFDHDGAIVSILDWSDAPEHELEAYGNFEPLKGIRYMGLGFLTYVPYNWCQEWIRQWEWWLEKKASDSEREGIISKNQVWKPLSL